MKNPEKLLDLLAQDARLTPAQLAAMLGETEEDVAAAINAYEKNSTILGYKTVVDWDKTSKESVTALIEVKITPQKGMGFDEIARVSDERRLRSDRYHQGTHHARGCPLCLRAAGADGERAVHRYAFHPQKIQGQQCGIRPGRQR
mgnify:CR=1 FL=1